MDNKICKNCGVANKKDSKFCTNCGTNLDQDSFGEKDNKENNKIPVVNNQTMEEEKVGNQLAIISLVLYFASQFIISITSAFLPNSIRYYYSALGGLGPIAGIVIMIFGRVHYPNNKLLKIAMWIIIGSMVLGAILFILFFIWCYIACSNVDTSGCG